MVYEEGGENSHGGNFLLTSQSVLFLQVSLWTPEEEQHLSPSRPLFTCSSVAIIWGMQPRAVQVRGRREEGEGEGKGEGKGEGGEGRGGEEEYEGIEPLLCHVVIDI